MNYETASFLFNKKPIVLEKIKENIPHQRVSTIIIELTKKRRRVSTKNQGVSVKRRRVFAERA